MHIQRPGHVPGRLVLGGPTGRRAVLAALAVLLAVQAWTLAVTPAQAQDDPALLRILAAPGGVGLMRHARAPGTGDPPGFRLGDCTTQRNLDDAGRAQARRLGERLRAAGLTGAAISASPWCRTTETATLLGLGPVTALPALASFFAGQGDESRQTADLRATLDAGRDGPPRIMVTHQVNITALTSLFPADAEMLVLQPGVRGYEVAGRLRTP